MSAELDARIPAYWATQADGRRIPFVLSLLVVDPSGREQLLPAVRRCIDKTVEVTGREGMVMVAVRDGQAQAPKVGRWVAQALAMPGAFVLFQCQSPDCMEQLMRCMQDCYEISLVKEDARDCPGFEGHVAVQ